MFRGFLWSPRVKQGLKLSANLETRQIIAERALLSQLLGPRLTPQVSITLNFVFFE